MLYQLLGISLGVLTAYLLGFKVSFLIVSVAIIISVPILLKLRSPRPGDPRDLRVCVVVCAHNEESTIERSLKSALNQTYDNLKVVVVDDASTDNTPEVLRKWKERFQDKLMILRNEKNLGKFKSMLRVFDETDCDVYVFIDADNEIPKDYVEHYTRFMGDYDMLGTPLSAYHESETLTATMHTIELLLLSFIRLFNLFPSFTGRATFLKRKVLVFIKNNEIFGIDDGAVMNAALDLGKFRYAFPMGPALKEMPTYKFEEFVKQRDRWYTLGIYEASRKGAKGVLVAFGFDVGFVLGGVVLAFLGGFHVLPPVFVASSSAIIGVVSAKIWETDLPLWTVCLTAVILVFLNSFLVTISMIKSFLGIIPKRWYRISRGSPSAG